MKRCKVVTAEMAARVIEDGDTVATGGFVGIGVPEELLVALEERFDETGSPRFDPGVPGRAGRRLSDGA